jgi:hypothetical protein
MKWLLAVVTVFMLAGCGDVEWLPDDGGTGTDASAPNAFTFTMKTGIIPGDTAQSDSVVITGDPTTTWNISISNGSSATESKYSINGGTLTDQPGTITANQNLRVTHKAPSTFSTIATTNIKIGTRSGSFQSQTTTQ